ncbi:hypothetical protein K110096F8_16180 [Dielma fastidiosa]
MDWNFVRTRRSLRNGMAANALTKYLNVKTGRLLSEYHVKYENRSRDSGREVTLTFALETND